MDRPTASRRVKDMIRWLQNDREGINGQQVNHSMMVKGGHGKKIK